MVKYYPANISLKNKRCVVFGAGQVALRKTKRLLECGARVFVAGQEIVPQFKRLLKKKSRFKGFKRGIFSSCRHRR
ncbi:MAG: NAD(P)-dependent oxidoreductase [Candidatus Omnitrophica bacterium]|nr:NAD(P)-dependent oxidoreductase [Candidatus Omnitrophota bacterium]MBU1924233.1 NAD(P)-dependent oxidoreductase [Candidatus Omnitrophota bacterium]